MLSWFKNNAQNILICLLIVLFTAFIAVMFSETVETCIGQLLGLSGNNGLKNDILTFLGLSMGGILLALQALIANTRAEAMEGAVREQARANENTETGQRQERLKNAIEHLGHTSDSVRLGGAYELFHLAQDIKEWRETILDILCSHIRQTTSESEYREKHNLKPSEEIQSLLTLLFVQEYEVFKSLRINLQGSWLNGAQLKNAHLSMANLADAHLQGAWLHDAHLQRANLVDAQLIEAIMPRVKLQGAVLQFAKLSGANLGGANLQGSDLFTARLQLANLGDTHMQGVNLTSARLEAANLSKARLQGANLNWAMLVAASLDQVHLEGVRSQPWSVQIPFADRMGMSIDKETDLSYVVIDGIEQGGVDTLKQDLSPHKAEVLQTIMEHHIGKSMSRQLPEDNNAITGSYTKEEAEQWIAEYNKTMSEVSKEDDS